jgi:hypothetical protein
MPVTVETGTDRVVDAGRAMHRIWRYSEVAEMAVTPGGANLGR